MAREQVSLRADVGEIEVALNSIIGAAEALVGKSATKEMSRTFQRVGQKYFHLHADSNPNISHVYEWERQGPNGRLYFIRWTKGPTSARGMVDFHPSLQEVPLDPAKIQEEQKKGRQIFRRYIFPEKAVVLETTQTIVTTPGVREHTEVAPGGEPSSDPVEWLVFVDGGRLRYTKQTLTRPNPHHKQFELFWDAFWLKHATPLVVAPMVTSWSMIAKAGVPREIQRNILMHAPRAVAGARTPSATPITVFGTSRPLKITTSVKIRNAVRARLVREWNRL